MTNLAGPAAARSLTASTSACVASILFGDDEDAGAVGDGHRQAVGLRPEVELGLRGGNRDQVAFSLKRKWATAITAIAPAKIPAEVRKPSSSFSANRSPAEVPRAKVKRIASQ
jgi:hypothetical protein